MARLGRRQPFAPKFRAPPVVGPVVLVAGAAAFDSCGPAGGSAFVKLTAADATGGTPAYTYQWQRGVDGGSVTNLANGGGVSGATTRTLTDGSAAAGHVYVYRLVYTDSAGSPQTATSNSVTAQVYTGGALGGTVGRVLRSGLIGRAVG